MKHLHPELASGEFDYTTIPPDIADLMRAAADRVSKLQRAAVIEIGRELLSVRGRIEEEQFVGWVERECEIPMPAAQYMIQVSYFGAAAGLLWLASPALGSVLHDTAGHRKLPHPRRATETKARSAIGHWVVSREPDGDQQRARKQEQREWGGEAKVRQHNALLAARMLKRRLGKDLPTFLAAAGKTDMQEIVKLLRCSANLNAHRKAAPARDRYAKDEPPLPF